MLRRAMTLIELLVASALAMLLMTASLGVIRSLVVQRRAIEAAIPLEPWRQRLSEQLRWDLANSRQMCSRTAELRLVGYGGSDFITAEATHRPTEIIYSIQNDGTHSWLLRREIHLDATTLKNSRHELVAAGITAIDINDADKPDDEQNQNRNATSDSNVVYTSIPKHVHAVLRGAKENEIAIDETIILQ